MRNQDFLSYGGGFKKWSELPRASRWSPGKRSDELARECPKVNPSSYYYSIFVAAVGATTVTGNGFAANIIMDKICLDVFNYTDAVCANLTAHEAELDSVIAFQNNFSLGIAWLGGVPAFLLSVLAGPASKRIGNRILLIMPTCVTIYPNCYQT